MWEEEEAGLGRDPRFHMHSSSYRQGMTLAKTYLLDLDLFRHCFAFLQKPNLFIRRYTRYSREVRRFLLNGKFFLHL